MIRSETTSTVAAHRAYGVGSSKAAQKRPWKDRTDLVKKYAPLVHRIAKRVRRRTGYAVELDDLICEGTIGLLQAAERFDTSRDTDFEHLASVRVHGAMLDTLRRLDPLSQRRRREARRMRDTRQKLEAALGRTAEPDEIARALDMSLEDYFRRSRELNISPAIPLDDLVHDVKAKQPSQEDLLQASQRHVQLKGMIDGLPERQKIVLKLIYYNELSQKEVAKVLCVTEARISQLHKEAIGRLKKRMVSAGRTSETLR